MKPGGPLPNPIKTLLAVAGKGDRQEFLKISKKINLLSNLQFLTTEEAGRVIQSYSKLNIRDAEVWKALEALFLQKEKDFPTTDYFNILFAMCKYSKNPVVWETAEKNVNSKILQIKQQQSKIHNVGLALYSFAYVNYRSEKLWQRFEYLVFEILPSLNERNLSQIIWALNRAGVNSKSLWSKLEAAVIKQINNFLLKNKVIITYCFAKQFQGSTDFWNIMERNFVQVPEEELSPRDFSQIVWAFAKVHKGSEKYWSFCEQFFIKRKNEMLSVNLSNCAYAFHFMDRKNKDLWENICNCFVNIKKFDLTQDTFDEILYISHIIEQRQRENHVFWEHAGNRFIMFLRSPSIIIDSDLKINYHIEILDKNKSLWNKELEAIYIKKTENALRKFNKGKFFKYVVDLIYLAERLVSRVSDSFWSVIFATFLKEVDLATIQTSPHDIAGYTRMVYILAEVMHKRDQANLQMLYDKVTSDQSLEIILKESKPTAILIKSLTQFKDQSENSWRNLSKHSHLINAADIQVLTSLIIAVISHNGFAFSISKHLSFYNLVKELFSDCSKENQRAMVEVMCNSLNRTSPLAFKKLEDFIQLLASLCGKKAQETNWEVFLTSKEQLEREGRKEELFNYLYNDFKDIEDENYDLAKKEVDLF